MRSKGISLVMGGTLLLAVTVGCSSEQVAENSKAPAKIAMPGSAADSLALPITGTVAESFESSGYNYLRLATPEGEHWIATSTGGFQEGDEVTINDGQLMQDFHSRTLDRTFSEIIFASNLGGGSNGQVLSPPSDHEMGSSSFAAALQNEGMGGMGGSMMGGMEGMMGGGMGKPPADIPLADIKVEKATGENSYRVAELFQAAAQLNGQEVTVRGQVMRVSANILNRNWIHIQDGSGDVDQATHNLVVSSADLPARGDVVTFKGVFAANKDIGSGYKYDAIVEQAEIIE
jgi:hypothetical protein